MTRVVIIRRGKETTTVFDSFKSAKKFFNKICKEMNVDKVERHSIDSVEEGYIDRVCLMRGRFVDTWRAL